jgi:hypothetical protein
LICDIDYVTISLKQTGDSGRGRIMTTPAANQGRDRSESQLAGPGLPERPAPSAIGAQRRLRALAARSWSPEAIEKETGIPAQFIRRELDGHDDLAPNLAGAVAAAYDRLWDRDPPTVTWADRETAAATAARAARSGWAPPMAWDDDRIDVPGARPERGWRPGRGINRRAADLVEDAEFVREHGGYRDASTVQVAMRLGIRRDRLDQAYIRARRYAARAAGRTAAEAEPEAEAG